VLREPLLKDVPTEIADPLADPGERCLYRLVRLPAQNFGLGSRARILELIEIRGIRFVVDGRIEGQIAHRLPLGFTPANLAAVVLEVPRDVRADPPHRVSREANVLLGVEVLDRLHQANVALLDQTLETSTSVCELLGYRYDKGEVRQGKLPPGGLVALLDSARELVLFLPTKLRPPVEVAQVVGQSFFGYNSSHRSPPFD